MKEIMVAFAASVIVLALAWLANLSEQYEALWPPPRLSIGETREHHRNTPANP
jgi:hypothetical protein